MSEVILKKSSGSQTAQAEDSIKRFERALQRRESMERTLEGRLAQALQQSTALSNRVTELEAALVSADEKAKEAEVLDKRLRAMQSVVGDLRSEVAEVRDENEQANRKLDDLYRSERLLRNDLEKSKEERDELLGKLNDLYNSLEQTHGQKTKCEECLEEIRRERDGIEQERQRLEAALQRSEKALERLKRDHEQTAAERELMSEVNSSLETRIKGVVADLREKETELVSAARQIESLRDERDALIEKRQEIDALFEKESTSRHYFEQKLASTRETLEQLREHYDQVSSSYEDAKTRLAAAEGRRAELQSANDKLKQSLEAAKDRETLLRKENGELYQETVDLRKREESARLLLEQERARLKIKETELQDMTRLKDGLAKDLADIRGEMADLADQKRKLDLDTYNFQREKEETQRELDELRARYEEATRVLGTLRSSLGSFDLEAPANAAVKTPVPDVVSVASPVAPPVQEEADQPEPSADQPPWEGAAVSEDEPAAEVIEDQIQEGEREEIPMAHAEEDGDEEIVEDDNKTEVNKSSTRLSMSDRIKSFSNRFN